jgi:hypothetical protein
MATPMRSTDFRAIVEPILNEEFDGIYQNRTDEWKGLFAESQGIARNYHEEPVLYGLGVAPELPDGSPVTYQSGGVLYVQRYLYKIYGLAFALTKVLVEDGDHIRLGQMFSRHLANALAETKETVTVNVLNRAFNTAYQGGDGVSLINGAHPIATFQGLINSPIQNTVGTFSNALTATGTVSANLSQTSLEQMLINIRNAVDNSGKRMHLKGKDLVVAPANMYQAEVILKTAQRSGTADNDKNPIMNALNIKVLSRLSNQKNWFIHTDAQEGLKLLKRRSMEKSMEGDFETDSMRYKATERYGVGWTDPRCLFASAGV